MWDSEVGRSFRKDADESKALQHTYQLIAKFKDQLNAELVASEENGAMNRKAIWVMDSLLRIPDLMVRRGKEAERLLEQIGGRNG